MSMLPLHDIGTENNFQFITSSNFYPLSNSKMWDGLFLSGFSWCIFYPASSFLLFISQWLASLASHKGLCMFSKNWCHLTRSNKSVFTCSEWPKGQKAFNCIQLLQHPIGSQMFLHQLFFFFFFCMSLMSFHVINHTNGDNGPHLVSLCLTDKRFLEFRPNTAYFHTSTHLHEGLSHHHLQ